MKGKFLIGLANGFGLGLSPIASGTTGSFWGLLIVWGMQYLPGVGWYVLVCALLAILAVPICEVGERHYKKKDDGRIVADEYLTFPICMIGLPVNPLVLAMAFVSNRVFDIIKPPPARQLQSLKGGIGIVIDDVIACLYSLALNHALWWAYSRYVLS